MSTPQHVAEIQDTSLFHSGTINGQKRARVCSCHSPFPTSFAWEAEQAEERVHAGSKSLRVSNCFFARSFPHRSRDPPCPAVRPPMVLTDFGNNLRNVGSTKELGADRRDLREPMQHGGANGRAVCRSRPLPWITHLAGSQGYMHALYPLHALRVWPEKWLPPSCTMVPRNPAST